MMWINYHFGVTVIQQTVDCVATAIKHKEKNLTKQWELAETQGRTTITDKITETTSNFHMKYFTTAKVQFLFFKSFCQY